MNVKNFCAALHNTYNNDNRVHFYAPTINLTVRYNRGNKLFGTVDTTTFTNSDTGEEIITIPSNIKEISKWSDWDFYLRGGVKIVSQHSPVYRLIKAIFNGKLIAAKSTEDEYDVDYDCDHLKGYEIIQERVNGLWHLLRIVPCYSYLAVSSQIT